MFYFSTFRNIYLRNYMNWSYHRDRLSVATCVDGGSGLCSAMPNIQGARRPL